MKLTNCSIRQFLALAGVLVLVGCGSVPRVEVQEVKVPVPVECREPIPDRPAMPTEALAEDAEPFTLLRAALAEIDRREGYEVQLLAALLACTRSVASYLDSGILQAFMLNVGLHYKSRNLAEFPSKASSRTCINEGYQFANCIKIID